MTRTKALLLVQGIPVCALCGGIGYACYQLGYKKGIVSGFDTGKIIGNVDAEIEHLRRLMFGDNDTKKEES